MFHDLSFRYKIPLRGTILILITSFAVTGALIFRAYDDLKQDLMANAEGLARVMAHTLVPAMLKDDVWNSYEIIRTPFNADLADRQSLGAETIVVLSNDFEVYVASNPEAFPMLTPISSAGTAYGQLQRHLENQPSTGTEVIDIAETDSLYVASPIISDNVRLGTLVMSYERAGFTPRFVRFASRAGIVTILVLGALVPLNWYWGARMAAPLVKLAGCMGRVGQENPSQLHCDLYKSKDEIGQVGVRFREMVSELQVKQALEKQVIAAERLAAVGRLTASIGHEINNPLGGMLNAINTYRRYGQLDPMTEKTVSLLERGLLQIRDTVSALLVEAKPTNRHFGPEDVEDVRTLITPDIQRQHASLEWHADIGTIPLPATLIRQILINLLLNAIKAVPPHGHVGCDIRIEAGALRLSVYNEGQPISGDRMRHLFEPFVHYRPDGNGLGLWVCYQIVDQLGGTIDAASDHQQTRFTANIPLPP
ncbi:sensor histidine kinase [Thiohalomonas denitrificans]|uniref:histidine kinase n=1 Tax=Thiohalomonas denitrificans TaxID=415747 RepID=A0A1G5PYE2_9GAMM|nr:HAMP domain-containing sensor histidine kinase [Thiohalomonas denitrificans]SCZ54523.1 His Kinase A (phospho-acceptor) domain-containing protein [Thiohalomonas denitrificans]